MATNGYAHGDPFSSPESDGLSKDRKALLLNAMREDAENLGTELRKAQAHTRKLQYGIEQVYNDRLDSEKRMFGMMKVVTVQQPEYAPCDEIRNHHRWMVCTRELRVTKQQLEKVNEDLVKANKNLVKANEDLEKANKEKRQLQIAWQELDNDFEKAMEVKERHQAKVKLVEQEKLALQEELKIIKLENRKAEEHRQADKLRSLEELKKVKEELFLVNEKMKKAISEKQSLEIAMQTVNDRIEKTKKDKERSQSKLESLEQENLELKEELKRMEVKQEEERRQFEEVQWIEHSDELRKLEEQLTEAKENFEKAISENKSLQNAMLDLNDRLEGETKLKERYHSKVELLEQDKLVLEEELRATREEIRRLEDDLAEASCHRRELETLKEKYAFQNAGTTADMQDDELSYLRNKAAINDVLTTRLRTTEEHLGESRRDNRSLHDKLVEVTAELQESKKAYNKLYTGMDEAIGTADKYKKEKEFYEKLYKSFKEKNLAELKQKDTKIAQQEKLITYLQCRIGTPKKAFCCMTPDRKPIGRLSTDDLGRALDFQRAKNVELACTVRRLQQQLTEKRLRRSFSEERVPIAKFDD